MNLVTYTSPASVSPRRITLSLYKDTLSRETFMIKGTGVLQLLTKSHIDLFHLLGKTSGREVDKIALIRSKGYMVKDWSHEAVLGDAACYLAIKAASDFIPCGDHDLVACDILDYDNRIGEESLDQVLYTSDLRARGLVV